MRKRKMTDSPVSDHLDTELDGEEEVDGESEPEEDQDVRIPSPPSGEITTPTAAVIRSVCKSSMAKRFAIKYKVPPEYHLCAPTADQRAHAPPPGYAAIYTHQFQYGLRLPLPPFVVSLLNHYKIALAQLYPACIVSILGFMEICNKVSIAPTPTLFRHFFRFRKSGKEQDSEGWYTLYNNWPKIVYGQPSGVHRWKGSFLFFKTAPVSEHVALSWNHSPDLNPPLVENEKPSEQTVSRFRANAERMARRPYNKRRLAAVKKEEERTIEEDSCMVSVPKSRSSKKKVVASRIQPKRSSKENKPTLYPSPTVKPKTSSTESPSATCRQKRMAESPATKPCKTRKGETGKKCVDLSSGVPSVPSLKEFAHDIQTRVYSFNLQLQGEKEVLEKAVAALEQDVKDKDIEIASLQGDKEDLEKVLAIKERDIKGKATKIASLQGYKEKLEKVVVDTKQRVKDKDNEISSIQGAKEELEKVLLDTKQSVQDRDNEIASLQGERKDFEVAMECDVKIKNKEISLLKSENDKLEMVNNLLKVENSRLKRVSDDEIVLLKAENSRLKSVRNDEISLLESKISRLKSVSNDEIGLLKAENSRLKSVSNDEISVLESEICRLKSVSIDEISGLKSENSRLKSVVEDCGSLLKVYTWKLFKTQAFASFLCNLTFLAQRLGRHEAVKQMRDHYPAIPEEALVGLEDPHAALKLDNQFYDMIQDDAFEFPLLDNLLSLDEIPALLS